MVCSTLKRLPTRTCWRRAVSANFASEWALQARDSTFWIHLFDFPEMKCQPRGQLQHRYIFNGANTDPYGHVILGAMATNTWKAAPVAGNLQTHVEYLIRGESEDELPHMCLWNNLTQSLTTNCTWYVFSVPARRQGPTLTTRDSEPVIYSCQSMVWPFCTAHWNYLYRKSVEQQKTED